MLNMEIICISILAFWVNRTAYINYSGISLLHWSTHVCMQAKPQKADLEQK